MARLFLRLLTCIQQNEVYVNERRLKTQTNCKSCKTHKGFSHVHQSCLNEYRHNLVAKTATTIENAILRCLMGIFLFIVLKDEILSTITKQLCHEPVAQS